jgi:uncharacterized protein YkwD
VRAPSTITTRAQGPENHPLSSNREGRLASPITAVTSRHDPRGWRSTARSRGRLLLVAGVTAVAFIVSAAGPHKTLAAACRGENAEPGRPSGQQIARATLCLINAERRSRGLRSVRPNARLSKSARRHSRDMVRRHYFSHTSPGCTTMSQRIRRSGYLRGADGWLIGETLAWGTEAEGTARRVVRAWMHSPNYRKVILTRSFRDAGVGVAWGVPDPHPAGGATYTVDLGVRH